MLKRFKSKLLKKENLTSDVLRLTFTKPEDFEFEAGQFLNIKIEQEGKMRMKAYSIASSPKQETLEFCIKLVTDGFASKKLKEIQINEELEMVGPFGGFKFNKETKKHVLIGAGTGIAPFMSMIRTHIEKQEFDFTLLMSYKTKENILYQKELENIQTTQKNFKNLITLTRQDWQGLTGRVQNHLNISTENTTFYICGVRDLVLETKDFLIQKGTQPNNIKIERYN